MNTVVASMLVTLAVLVPASARAQSFSVPSSPTADGAGICSPFTYSGPHSPAFVNHFECTTLREAINQANAAGTAEILLHDAVYVISLSGAEDANLTGDFDVTGSDIRIRGLGVANTFIDGLPIKSLTRGNADRLLHVLPGAQLTIVEVRLQNGRTHAGGGAIRNEGALFATEVDFWDNVNDQLWGGAAPGGALYNSGSATLSDVLFQENVTAEGNGGAIGNDGGSVSILASGRVHSRFEQNDADDGSGGAIYSADGTVDIVDTVVSSGAADFMGGCIHLHDGAVLDMRRSSIDECTQRRSHVGIPTSDEVMGGGALSLGHIDLAAGGTTAPASATLENVAIGANTANGYGGAIYIQDGIGAADLSWVTIANNTGTAPLYYPGMFTWSTAPDVSLHCGPGTNCTTEYSVVVDGCYGVAPVAGTSNLEDSVGKTSASCGFTSFGAFNSTGWAGSGVGNETMAAWIDPTSGAWQAGPAASTGQVDQTGLPRTGFCDLGAFERSP